MAGQNRVFKEGEVLFRQGDAADCMYLVRRGALKVFIAKDDSEVTLATLDAGAIVGEMAFFDNKPRSASVKAATATEVTEISRADFNKLLTQIPKWMVTMMQSLSGRLRSTNERLEKLEDASRVAAGGSILPGQKYPFQIIQKSLRCLTLSLARDGEKLGREHAVTLENTKELWNEIVSAEPAVFDRLLGKLISTGMVAVRKNEMKQDVIVFVNRGAFALLADTLSKYAPRFSAAKPFLDEHALVLLRTLVDSTVSSGYESLNVNLMELAAQTKAKGVDTSSWGNAIGELVKKFDLKIAKNGSAIMVKINAKEHKNLRTAVDLMAELHAEGLS